MFNEYDKKVKLLLNCLPVVAKSKDFALKGGTAINMFIREQYPRLSVDIDLCYLPILPREESIMGIQSGMLEMIQGIQQKFNYKIDQRENKATKTLVKFDVIDNDVKIKIEPNFVLRGTLYPTMQQNLSDQVIERYEQKVINMRLVSKEEIYAGKICAALDRQHPRDLFDIKFILEEGITNKTKIAFLIYLISNNRPIYELLKPNRLDQRQTYQDEFKGMAFIDVSYDEMENIREQLINTISSMLTESDKEFLLNFKRGEPNWEYIPVPHVAELPAIKWKLLNLKKMDKEKHQMFLEKLEQVLYG